MGCHLLCCGLAVWLDFAKKKKETALFRGGTEQVCLCDGSIVGTQDSKNIFPRLSYVKQDIADRIYTEHRYRVRKSPIIRHFMQDYRVISWRVGMGLLGTLYRRIHGRNLGHCFIEVLKSGGSVFHLTAPIRRI